jgi:hypothetical protein
LGQLPRTLGLTIDLNVDRFDKRWENNKMMDVHNFLMELATVKPPEFKCGLDDEGQDQKKFLTEEEKGFTIAQTGVNRNLMKTWIFYTLISTMILKN